MHHIAVFPGRYCQGEGVLRHLGEECSRLGRKALLIASRTAMRTEAEPLLPLWRRSLDLDVEEFKGECCDTEIQRLAAVAAKMEADIVVGLGGGKVIDTAKAVAALRSIRKVIVPTIASTDAPCSAVSVIYTEESCFQRCVIHSRNPDVVLVDTGVVARAPARFLVAGMGDALSTWFEADACRQTRSHNECGGISTLTGLSLARLCYDTLIENGVAAKLACERQVVTPAFERIVEANTLLSGLGFESSGLAAAHSIHNGLTLLPGSHGAYHGEKVAIGVLAGLFLVGRPWQLIDEVYGFCESVGLPTTLSDIGLAEASDEELTTAATGACAAIESIHHEPCEVTPSRVAAALRCADDYGRQRRNQSAPAK